jgi:aromatic-L-amino-acid/L-tryptophan decarboxylase
MSTLDPNNWDDARAMGHRMVDDMFEYLRTLPDRPPWRPMPESVKNALQMDPPHQGVNLSAAYEEFTKNILPYPVGNVHPRFWGWAQGCGTVTGAMAEFLAASMNCMSWGGDQAGVYVEKQVLSWMKSLMGFPSSASGILTSGTSTATLIALAVIRKKYAPKETSDSGVNQSIHPLRFYCSSETHNCLARTADITGMGKQNVVTIPVNSRYEMNTVLLEEKIIEDKERGHVPACVVGTAGTIGTGAIDDLNTIAEICARHGLWFHVDGAVGAVLRCSKKLAPLLSGMERADSLAFDLHKWFFVPYDAGCILIRDSQLHKQTFSNPASYLALMDGGVTPQDGFFFNDYGIELSRGMKALKVWMSIKEHGLDRYGEIMEQNVNQARYLGSKLQNHEELELVATGPLNTVCFRYAPKNWDTKSLNSLNKKLLVEIQERGVAVPSPFTTDGKFSIRVCITNHRTKNADLDYFLTELLKIGRELQTAKPWEA